MAPFSIPQHQRRILGGLLIVIGAALWAQFFFFPQFRTAGRLRIELKSLRGQMERPRRDLAQMPSLEKKMALLASQVPLPVPTVPPEEQLPDLLEKITQAARIAHVQVTTLKPKHELSQMQVGPSGCLEIPLELVATAGYHQLGRFLDELERSESLVRLRELEINPSGDDLTSHGVKMDLLAFLVPVSSGEKP